MKFLLQPAAVVLTVFLLTQIAVVHGVSRTENPPAVAPLASLPRQWDDWVMIQEGVVEKEVQDVLKATDAVTRVYRHPSRPEPVSMFVAYFRSQRSGVAPHSPKNCLPGSGWAPLRSETAEVAVKGQAGPIAVNLYIVGKGDARSVVFYWYQSYGEAIASEYSARLHLVLGAIRYNRSDAAMVRVVVPVDSEQQEAGIAAGRHFIGDFFPKIRAHLSL